MHCSFLFPCFCLPLTSLTHFPVLDLCCPPFHSCLLPLHVDLSKPFSVTSPRSSPTFLTHLLVPHPFFLPSFLLCSSLPFLSLRCRMLWAMSCHGSILSLLSSSALFSFSISFWECWAGKRLRCCHVCVYSMCIFTVLNVINDNVTRLP